MSLNNYSTPDVNHCKIYPLNISFNSGLKHFYRQNIHKTKNAYSYQFTNLSLISKVLPVSISASSSLGFSWEVVALALLLSTTFVAALKKRMCEGRKEKWGHF